MTFSFTQQQRLRSKKHFQEVFSHRKRWYGDFFILYHKPNQLDHGRVGIVASKRNTKLSVQRNRLKRILRESFRHHQDSLRGLDLVFVVNREAKLATQDQLNLCINDLYHRLLGYYKKR